MSSRNNTLVPDLELSKSPRSTSRGSTVQSQTGKLNAPNQIAKSKSKEAITGLRTNRKSRSITGVTLKAKSNSITANAASTSVRPNSITGAAESGGARLRSKSITGTGAVVKTAKLSFVAGTKPARLSTAGLKPTSQHKVIKEAGSLGSVEHEPLPHRKTSFNIPKRNSSLEGSVAGSGNSSQGYDGMHSAISTAETLTPPFLQPRLLTTLIFIGLVLGVTLGFVLKITRPKCFWTNRKVMYVEFLGRLFRNILSALRLPVAVSSIVAAIGSMDLKIFRSIGAKAFFYFIFSMFISAVLGSSMGFCLGSNFAQVSKDCKRDFCGELCPRWNNAELNPCVFYSDLYMDYFRSIIPPNWIQSFVETESTLLDFSSSQGNFSCDTPANQRPALETFSIAHVWRKLPNAVGVFSISVFFGIIALWVGEAAKQVLNIFISCSEVFLQVATWTLWLAPGGIFFLIAARIIDNENPFLISASIGRFLAIIILTFLVQSFIVLPLIYAYFVGKSPRKFYKDIVPIIATAYGTASSAATLPMTIRGLEDFAQLDPRVVRFIVPIGTVFSANGTMIYVACSASFLILRHVGYPGFVGHMGIIFVIFTLTLPANTGLPRTEYFTIPSILTIFSVDPNVTLEISAIIWIFDQLIVVTNVVSVCVCAAVINRMSRRQLRNLTLEEERILKAMELAEEKALKEKELEEANKAWHTIGHIPNSTTPISGAVMDRFRTDV